MAVVIRNDLVNDYLENKMAIKNGITKSIVIDGVTHCDIITYPEQDNFENGAILCLIQKPFIDFAVSCGGAGSMTAEQIVEKYGNDVPLALAETLAADFSKAYGNYIIIPESITLAITAPPINSLFDLTIKEEEEEKKEVTD